MGQCLCFDSTKKIMCDMTPCVTYVGVGAREGRDLIAVSGRGRARHHHPPGPWDPTVKKFSPDPNERFLKMSWGPGLGPRSRQKSSPQEIVTVRYFPDFSRPEVLERERTCKEVENCHRPTLTGSFLSKIPPVEVVGNRLFPQLRSDPSHPFLCQSEIRKSATVFLRNKCHSS